MRSREIARRYAQALYELADEQGVVADVEQEFVQFASDVDEVPELGAFLTHPLISRDDKVSTIERAFPDLSTYLHNLLLVLIRNRREGYLSMICAEYVALRAKARDVLQVRLLTATNLPDDMRTRFQERLGKITNQTIELQEHVVPDLIGGARIEVDGKVIDGTLRAKLNQLQEQLAG